MRISKHARSFKRVLYAPVTLIVLAILSIVLIRSAVGAYLNDRRNSVNLSDVQKNTEELRVREDFLSEEIERLNSPRGMEAELRNKFPVVKEGENMVIIVEPEAEGGTVSTDNTGGFWSKVRSLFKF